MLALTLVAASVLTSTGFAQAAPRRLVGTVRDSSGRALDNAVVSLDPMENSRATRTDQRGRFRFDNVPPGRHQVRTTWIGYRPDDREIEVPSEGLEITVVLAELPFQLDTLRIAAAITGIFGHAIARPDFRPLGGADIEVLGGARTRARTNPDGRFSFPGVREGAYVVKAVRRGFKTRLLPVPVPRDEAVEIALVLDSAATRGDLIAENLYRDFEMRWNRRSATGSAMVARHELAASRGARLDHALRYAPSYLYKGFIIDNEECVYVNGRPAPGRQVRDFHADEVDMVELYTWGAGGTSNLDAELFRALGQSACGAFRADQEFESEKGVFRVRGRPKLGAVAFVYIWLKP